MIKVEEEKEGACECAVVLASVVVVVGCEGFPTGEGLKCACVDYVN